MEARAPKKQEHSAKKKTTKNTPQQSPQTPTPEQEGDAPQAEPLFGSHFLLQDFPPTEAREVVLKDFDSDMVLFSKNADVLMTPSSMTKIATACFIARKIKSGELSPAIEFSVSSHAYRREGTTMFLNINQKVSVSKLLEGLLVVSGNDAAVVLSEGVCGSEAAFGAELTSFVRSFGALSTTFVNGSGLPDPAHKTTAQDLALIATHAIAAYPEIYPLYSQKELTFNGVPQHTKNVLLDRDIGCDGLKTGMTAEGGYGIVASCVQEGRRLILVANGYKNEKDRANNASALMTWAYRMFVNHGLYKANDPIAKLPVWYGNESFLPVIVEEDVWITLPRASQYDVKILLCYDTPLAAPIEKGAAVGEIQMTSSSWKKPVVIPLVAAESIREASFFKKISDSLAYLLFGIKNPPALSQEAKKQKRGES
ncbi:D-alanyl-D-alanine carboxypeptidase [Alphaproteobacteria bacterium]|nr:D-alanyl-D-alanine carboxypeptidase [Alphaproteobacteria bacterium]